mgnify:FL=1
MSLLVLFQAGAAPQEFTLSADAGSHAIAGISADLTLVGYLEALYGSYAWTGYAADLILDIGFPVQYSGLRFWDGQVRELSLVAESDAPGGIGGVLKVRKGGVTYAVYIVEPDDPNASRIRVQTNAGIKALRLKT